MRDIGSTIKASRVALGLSQAELAAGVCAQSMISGLENGKYVPNAALLLALAQRLNIDVNSISLARGYLVSHEPKINATCHQLCNGHRYAELGKFLRQQTVLDNLESAVQTQAYYYYLAVSQYHARDFDSALASLKLAMAEANLSHLSTLSRLCLISVALVCSEKGHWSQALTALNSAISDLKTVAYEENLHVLYYLSALIYFKHGEVERAFLTITDGITLIVAHDSHYMLANCYFLLAELAVRMQKGDLAHTARTRSRVLEDIYCDDIYKDF
ncbi:XRE family transcriptional regulator [Lactobacillus sp. PFC-70]|nr:XRE family transcriptional regulator [Lactobacillus sp. PFC-70]